MSMILVTLSNYEDKNMFLIPETAFVWLEKFTLENHGAKSLSIPNDIAAEMSAAWTYKGDITKPIRISSSTALNDIMLFLSSQADTADCYGDLGRFAKDHEYKIVDEYEGMIY